MSITFLAWAVGLYRFSQLIPEPVFGKVKATDAIVVLTGGAGRIGAGLSLLERGLGKKLFVSGVYRGIDVQELLKVARRAPGNLQCCIALGYAADNTRGNAIETAEWIGRENIGSMRIVTASYHMPRSLLEFRRVLPSGIVIVAHPVFPKGFPAKNWWRDIGALRLAVSEYHKYLMALLEEKLL
ncbi:MAG: YdcF family protein [Pseudomonadota bacterium]|nr:YdcF family protein [Pseudomonadota bacterium]